MYELNIDEEFRRLHIPMVEKKLKRLEQNIYQRGATRPILIWNGYIVDGHKRNDIFHRRNIPFRVYCVDFPGRTEVMEWLCDKNLLRQDLTEEYRKYFIGKKLSFHYSLIKKDGNTTTDLKAGSNEPQNKYLLALQIGQTFNLSYVTVLKYAQYAQAIDYIYKYEPGMAEQILTAHMKVSHNNVLLISQLPPADLKKLRSGFDSGRFDKLITSQIWHELREENKNLLIEKYRIITHLMVRCKKCFMEEIEMRKVVTTYINPDMDGISLMYAYTEFLRKKGEDAEYYFEGTMKKEAEIVLQMFNIHLNNIARIKNNDKIVLVDTNYLSELSKAVKKENVIEVIDHHNRESWLDENPNLKVQIELIGAAATLVAERFKNENNKYK